MQVFCCFRKAQCFGNSDKVAQVAQLHDRLLPV
jgi:hypothetical protein